MRSDRRDWIGAIDRMRRDDALLLIERLNLGGPAIEPEPLDPFEDVDLYADRQEARAVALGYVKVSDALPMVWMGAAGPRV